MKDIEQTIIKGFQWFLGIVFISMSIIILSSTGDALGLAYLVLGGITIPLLELPKGFRTIAIIAGSLLL